MLNNHKSPTQNHILPRRHNPLIHMPNSRQSHSTHNDQPTKQPHQNRLKNHPTPTQPTRIQILLPTRTYLHQSSPTQIKRHSPQVTKRKLRHQTLPNQTQSRITMHLPSNSQALPQNMPHNNQTTNHHQAHNPRQPKPINNQLPKRHTPKLTTTPPTRTKIRLRKPRTKHSRANHRPQARKHK